MLVKWGLGLLPLGAVVKSALDAWSQGQDLLAKLLQATSWFVHPASVALLFVILLLFFYLYWGEVGCSRSVRFLEICTPSEKISRTLVLTAADLVPNDLLRRWSEKTPDFLKRRVRLFKVETDERTPEMDGVQAIIDCWKTNRPVAILGPGGMGKTRLVCEAIKVQSPTTLVISASHNANGDRSARATSLYVGSAGRGYF